MMSMNVFAPTFILASGVPAILPERSKTRTMSVGFEEISGLAARASVTFNVPLQSIWSTLICLFELVTAHMVASYRKSGLLHPFYTMRQWSSRAPTKLYFVFRQEKRTPQSEVRLPLDTTNLILMVLAFMSNTFNQANRGRLYRTFCNQRMQKSILSSVTSGHSLRY